MWRTLLSTYSKRGTGMDSKPCSWCGVEKPSTEFYKNNSTKSGLSPRCRPCQRNPDPEIRAVKPKKGCLTAYCTGKPVTDGYCKKCSAMIVSENLFSLEKWTNYYREKGWL